MNINLINVYSRNHLSIQVIQKYKSNNNSKIALKTFSKLLLLCKINPPILRIIGFMIRLHIVCIGMHFFIFVYTLLVKMLFKKKLWGDVY